jgi:predicted NUDIX family phosphoesterase
MSASEAERDLVLFTFNDIHLKTEFETFYEFISSNRFNVKHLYKAFKLYQQNRKNSQQNIDIFKFIYDSKDLILANF